MCGANNQRWADECVRHSPIRVHSVGVLADLKDLFLWAADFRGPGCPVPVQARVEFPAEQAKQAKQAKQAE